MQSGHLPGFGHADLAPGRTGNAILDLLPDGSIERLLPRLTRQRLRPSEGLGPQASSGRAAFFPLQGAIVDRFVSADGVSLGASFVGREGMVGLRMWMGASWQRSDWHAVTPTDGWALPVTALHDDVDEVVPVLLRLAAARLDELRQDVACQRLHSLTERIARCLLEITERAGKRDLHLTHQDVADFVGASRPRVTAAVDALAAAGAIERGRGTITIRDWRVLSDASCECYSTVRGAFAAAGIARARARTIEESVRTRSEWAASTIARSTRTAAAATRLIEEAQRQQRG